MGLLDLTCYLDTCLKIPSQLFGNASLNRMVHVWKMCAVLPDWKTACVLPLHRNVSHEYTLSFTSVFLKVFEKSARDHSKSTATLTVSYWSLCC